MDIALNDNEFALFQRLVYEESGINLSTAKKELLKSRLMKRLRQMSLTSFNQYFKYVTEEDKTGVELIHMIDSISTNLTDFFRESAHFDFLANKLLPDLLEQKRKKRERRIRIWSAGCSSGEEPYTLSLVLIENITELQQWDVKILATDLSTKVLKKAMQGIYSKDRLKNVPSSLVNTYFTKGVGNNSDYYQVKDELKNLITFRRFNLMDGMFPFKGLFDVIFCRNVMIYFDKQTQSELIAKYYKYLAPGGYLFIGHSESLSGTGSGFRYVLPTIYQK
ncbi:MAG: protein-glutamate O-methyltransferase CheR [Candidatus Brocadiaceae bacterium]|nr:protein-glutamate O-methyltransferase CheR [Candidatus Brocadiaceae bacterium]